MGDMPHFMADDALQLLIRNCGEYSARQSYRIETECGGIYPCVIVTIKFQPPVHTHF